MSVSKKKQRGGKREGAGRKPIMKDSVKKTVTFPQDTVDQVLKISTDFGTYVREATHEKLAREKKK